MSLRCSEDTSLLFLPVHHVMPSCTQASEQLSEGSNHTTQLPVRSLLTSPGPLSSRSSQLSQFQVQHLWIWSKISDVLHQSYP